MANTSKGKGSRSSKTDRVLGLLVDPSPLADGQSDGSGHGRPDDRVTQNDIRSALQSALEQDGATEIVTEPEFVPMAPEQVPRPTERVTQPTDARRQDAPDTEELPETVILDGPFGGADDLPKTQPLDTGAAPIAQPLNGGTRPSDGRGPGNNYNVEDLPKTQPLGVGRSGGAGRQDAEFVPKPVYSDMEERWAARHISPAKPHRRLDDDGDYFYYNIAQSLVEAKVDQYIKRTGVCRCERCRMDIVALSLTNLPPKYVVTKSADLVPRLSIYEQDYSTDITTQVLNACNRVAKHPHHDRS